jgi:hypothetical protein
VEAQQMMPGLAQRAGGHLLRSLTFNANPRTLRGTTGHLLPPPVYAYPR